MRAKSHDPGRGVRRTRSAKTTLVRSGRRGTGNTGDRLVAGPGCVRGGPAGMAGAAIEELPGAEPDRVVGALGRGCARTSVGVSAPGRRVGPGLGGRLPRRAPDPG